MPGVGIRDFYIMAMTEHRTKRFCTRFHAIGREELSAASRRWIGGWMPWR